MLEKIKELLSKTVQKIPASIGTKAIVYYALVLAVEILLFNIAFCYNWYASGKAEITTLIQFLTVLVGAQFTSAILLIGKGFVDNDGNGVPDVLEDSESKTKEEGNGE
ncbi:MAG: hypothetical protein DBY32_04155 [Phascolarctobacterium sp.]|nr:MAG: hypothetical protein DBY32_04155 [Phascolarctobacterium sp.]